MTDLIINVSPAMPFEEVHAWCKEYGWTARYTTWRARRAYKKWCKEQDV